MRRVFLDTNILLDFAEFCDLPYMTATEFLERWD